MTDYRQGTGHETPADRAHEAHRLVEQLAELTPEMKEHEAAFIQSMGKRLEKWGDGTFVSPKQLYWLRDLRDKYA